MLFSWLLMAMLAWGALSFGAVLPWAYWPLAIMAAALGVWGAVVSAAWTDPRTRRLSAALALVAAAIVAQLLPLPHWLLRKLSPGVDRFFEMYRIGYVPDRYLATSVAPVYTVITIGLYCAFALLLVGLVRMLRRLPLEWIVTQLMGLGVGLALLGIVQRAFADPKGSNSIYGLTEHIPGASPFGPFVNRNHFATWMIMALPIVIGYSIGLVKRTWHPRRFTMSAWLAWLPTVDANRFVLVMTAAFTMLVALVLTQSRSGLMAFMVAMIVLAVAFLRRHRTRAARIAAVAYFSLLLLGAIGWIGLDLSLSRFGSSQHDLGGRMTAWIDTVHIVRDFPLFGTGLGTYGEAMLVYQTDRVEGMFVRAHNDYLQLAAEGGLLVLVPVALLVVVLAQALRRRFEAGEDDELTYWIRVGAAAGLAGVAVQSSVEFGLQMPGNTALFVVVLALAIHRPSRRSVHAHRV